MDKRKINGIFGLPVTDTKVLDNEAGVGVVDRGILMVP